MKRRDFIAAAVVAPAGMVGAEEKVSQTYSVALVVVDNTAATKAGLEFENKDDGNRYDEALMAFWRDAIGRKTVTTIHKNGLNIRFV